MILGLIPVPTLDILALTHAQFKMTDDLLKLYGIAHSKIGRSGDLLHNSIIDLAPGVDEISNNHIENNKIK